MFPKEKHNLADEKAMILRLFLGTPMGVRQLASALHWAPARVMAMEAEMEEHGLLAPTSEVRKVRGRPKHLLRPTSLGRDYLLAYSMLELKELKAKPADLRRAVRDAKYARRLSAGGRSASDLFLELNEIALLHR